MVILLTSVPDDVQGDFRKVHDNKHVSERVDMHLVGVEHRRVGVDDVTLCIDHVVLELYRN